VSLKQRIRAAFEKRKKLTWAEKIAREKSARRVGYFWLICCGFLFLLTLAMPDDIPLPKLVLQLLVGGLAFFWMNQISHSYMLQEIYELRDQLEKKESN